MIKKDSLKDELFIVLLLNGDVLKNCRTIQKNIADYYDLYEGNDLYPELHITINRIYKEDIQEAVSILNDLTKEFQEIKIELDSFSCYRQVNSKFLVLKINESNSLSTFAKELHKRLMKKGISAIDDYEKWEFHITILSNIFASNPVNNPDFESLCSFMEGDGYSSSSYSNIIEIWSPINEDDKKTLYSFSLKDLD